MTNIIEDTIINIISNSKLYLQIAMYIYHDNGYYLACYSRKQANQMLAEKFNCSISDLQFFWKYGLIRVHFLGGIFPTNKGFLLFTKLKEKETKGD
jgi:hypothetical protein